MHLGPLLVGGGGQDGCVSASTFREAGHDIAPRKEVVGVVHLAVPMCQH